MWISRKRYNEEKWALLAEAARLHDEIRRVIKQRGEMADLAHKAVDQARQTTDFYESWDYVTETLSRYERQKARAFALDEFAYKLQEIGIQGLTSIVPIKPYEFGSRDVARNVFEILDPMRREAHQRSDDAHSAYLLARDKHDAKFNVGDQEKSA